MREKHNTTFRVKALARRDNEGREHFHYIEAAFSRSPITASLGPLLSQGLVTLDFLIKLKANGATRDHGYLFRIHASHWSLLFPPSQHFDLRTSGLLGT